MGRKLYAGVGINDADYLLKITETVSKRGEKQKQRVIWRCPYYSRWANLITRCYNGKYLSKRSYYSECEVCEEWLTFSNFKAWMEKQDWQGKELDKDLLVRGNKLYSPETCTFLSPNINSFLVDSKKKRGEYPIGVSFHKASQKLRATCLDGSRKQIHLGFFDNAEDAHEAWRKCKHDLACKLADEQTDERVANALRIRFSKQGEWQSS